MNCREAQKLLSPRHDDELSPETRVAADAHFDDCSDCATELDAMQRLSLLASTLIDRELSDVAPPEHLWSRIQERLDAIQELQDAQEVQPRKKRHPWRRSSATLFAFAASILFFLVASGLGVYFDRQGAASQDDLADYWQSFESDPVHAQEYLLARYSGRAVSGEQAQRFVGYRTLAAKHAPADIAAVKTYAISMPSCKCIQTVCRRVDGTVLAVFEHRQEQPGWFQGLPRKQIRFGGASCRVAELGGQLAASWRVEGRSVTIVGLRNIEELRRWVQALAPASVNVVHESHASKQRQRFFKQSTPPLFEWSSPNHESFISPHSA